MNHTFNLHASGQRLLCLPIDKSLKSACSMSTAVYSMHAPYVLWQSRGCEYIASRFIGTNGWCARFSCPTLCVLQTCCTGAGTFSHPSRKMLPKSATSSVRPCLQTRRSGPFRTSTTPASAMLHGRRHVHPHPRRSVPQETPFVAISFQKHGRRPVRRPVSQSSGTSLSPRSRHVSHGQRPPPGGAHGLPLARRPAIRPLRNPHPHPHALRQRSQPRMHACPISMPFHACVLEGRRHRMSCQLATEHKQAVHSPNAHSH